MQANETPKSTGKETVIVPRQHAAGHYIKARDGRKQPIRGLWKRGETFYAQLSVRDPQTALKVVRRVRIEDKDGNGVTTLAEALKGMHRLRVKRDDDSLTLNPKRTPTLAEYAVKHVERIEALGDRRPGGIKRERVVARLLTHDPIGALRLRQLTPGVMRDFQTRRRAAGVSPRGVNIEASIIRNVCRSAIDDGWLSTLPTVKRLKEPKPVRRCLTPAEVERVAQAALEGPQTGRMVADYILLLAYCGARASEALRIRWRDVDFDGGQLLIGADGLSKNGESRAVNLNPRLRQHLMEMQARRRPDSEYLFPCPRSEGADLPVKSFNVALRGARERSGVRDFHPHACRHHFASMALMSGCDLGTVAAWLGHRDNGALLAKTYSHLLGTHKAAQALKVRFEPVVLRVAEGGQ